MKPVLLLTLLALMLSALVLVGCESPAAQREQARADRIRAEASAYEKEKQADAEYNTQVTLNRQYERDASHERTMESLPFVLAIGGGVVVLCLGLFAWWDLRSRPPTPISQPVNDNLPAVRSPEWEDLARALAERDRQIWHVLAVLAQRQQQIDARNGYEEGR